MTNMINDDLIDDLDELDLTLIDKINKSRVNRSIATSAFDFLEEDPSSRVKSPDYTKIKTAGYALHVREPISFKIIR